MTGPAIDPNTIEGYFSAVDAELAPARQILKRGGSLREAAAKIGWSASDLDKALWKRLGRR